MSPCDKKLTDELHDLAAEHRALTERVAALDRLMEAKFVTFQVMVESQAEKVSLALAAADKAVTKAEDATEKRFESVNEFRLTLSDRDRLSMTRTEFETFKEGSRSEFDQLRSSNAEKFTGILARLDRAEGKGAGIGAVWGWVVGGAGVASALTVVIVQLIR
jgi:acyl transferase domain-containing protein